tara:strand:+ start:425 stop:808 length:384 start_codon:yes stop_codon:yes gene_type:complete
MASKGNWTVIFDDKMIINQSVTNSNGYGTSYIIDDDSFWNQEKFSNIWAIQYHDDNLDHNDTIEYRDETPHATWNNANLGDFQDFITKWDATHLVELQSNWDANNVDGESEADKISRLGPRPTSYSS